MTKTERVLTVAFLLSAFIGATAQGLPLEVMSALVVVCLGSGGALGIKWLWDATGKL